MEEYQDAYEILKNIDRATKIQDKDFDDLIKVFMKGYLKSKDFDERINRHREPSSLINEILNELYSYTLKIQGRDEMRDIDGDVYGYVPTKVIDEWKSDKRLKSLYNSVFYYCQNRSKEFNVIAVHIAEYRAIIKLIARLRRKINRKPVFQTEEKIKASPITKKIRIKIPKENKVRAELQKEIRSVCPFCDNNDVGHFQIHHIDEEPSNNTMNNLLLVCPNCHSKITKGDITADEVAKRKNGLESNNQGLRSAKVVNFNSKVATSIIGDNNTITIKNTHSSKQKYPPGCIGYETVKANYISHLIGRYNEYKEYDLGKGNVKYAVFFSHLKKQYKIGPTRTIYHLPAQKFDELVEYIQYRINNTMLAKVKGSRHRNYSTFDEFQKLQVNVQ
jgi:hypothetical protein